MRIRPTPRRITLLVFFLGYILFFMLGGCADQFVLFPQIGPVPAPGAKATSIPFEDGRLEILVARSPGAATRPVEAYVLGFVGNAARAEHVAGYDAAEWRDKPVEVWMVNHPGYGNSTGPARLDRLARAGLAAYDALAARAGGRPILVSGFSLGTTIALHAAANRPVAGLILRSPPPLRSLILRRHGWWNLWLLATPVALGIPGQLDSLKNAKNVTAPAVFLLTDADEVVPVRYQRMVYDAYAGEKHAVVDTGGHNGLLDQSTRAEMAEKRQWLWAAALRSRLVSP